MAKHKFATGDRVMVLATGSSGNVRPGVYTIVKTMPDNARGCQYRAKSAVDVHERVLDESQLRRPDGTEPGDTLFRR